MSSTATAPSSFDDVTGEQVESFRRDGFLTLEEGFLSEGAIDILRERFAALFEGDYATGVAPTRSTGRRAATRRTAPARSAPAGAPTT